MLDKLERKIGKFAIPHLINYLIGGYAIGYIFTMMENMFQGYSIISLMTLDPYMIINKLQIWRVITWVLIPPQQNFFWALIMMFFYWQLGTVLERTMGTFRFNVYIFGGIISTVIGAFLLYGIFALQGQLVYGIGQYISTYYSNLGIFLAFATLYPNEQVLLYFLIPVKMKWLAVLDIVLLVVDFVGYNNWSIRMLIIASLLNFLIFFLMTRDFRKIDPREMKRKADFRNAYNRGARTNPFERGPFAAGNQQQSGNPFGGSTGGDRVDPFEAARRNAASRVGARHKCDICGRTEVTNPELDFRFCSKCSGRHEYCNEHLFTHAHIQ